MSRMTARGRSLCLLATVLATLTIAAVAETGAAAADSGGIPIESVIAGSGSAESGSASDPVAGGSGSASSGSGTGSASGSASGSAAVPLASPRAMSAMNVARTQLGKPYQWGGTGPNAFDCSGLVQWAYRWVGIFLPRTTWQQARAGSAVPLFAIQPGDVVVVNRDGSHEGIYVGNGMLLNAYDYGVGVVYTPLIQFHIFAIRPDGTSLAQLTKGPYDDTHPACAPDGEHVLFSTSRFGFKDEAPLYDRIPQPYGELFVMKVDGSEQRPLTDNTWEDATPAWQPQSPRNGR